ncbi:hypothetical protein BCR39DRAFT_527136 [Naematelia encephala]|uniref:DUF3533 domain-containing protein n=1 Tax=Naematelia encephala TaxID=71784 RepID=A0A1Y2B924_9TREE|nr:hypothetical protein BCR39DRAFT_527136 [Naematelia encephala]
MGGKADSPSIKSMFTSRTGPDGSERYGFFAPELANARKEWAKVTAIAFTMITVCMFGLLSIYFGSYYQQIPRAAHFSVQIIDLDSIASPYGSVAHPAILGPAVRQAASTALGSEPHLGWYEADTATLQNFRLTETGQGLDAYEYGMKIVTDQDVWAVIIVNANATSGAWSAITSGTEWDPSGAITFIYEEARNFYGTDQYVSRLTTDLLTSATGSAATTLASQVLALGNASAVLGSAAQGSISGAFAYNLVTIHPFDQLAGIPATTVGTIYLIIFTFLISGSWNNLGLPIIQDKLALGSEIAIKILVPLGAYLWLSLHYSLVSLAFLVDFTRKFGKGGFVVYWMADWITMSALGFVMETFFLWLGPWFSFFLVFWVVLNVSVAFLSIADAADFYRYGYILPVWNLVDMAKSIIFATKNHLAQNFAVNIGWMLVWMIILTVTVVVQRRKKEAVRMKAKWEEMKRLDGERGKAL